MELGYPAALAVTLVVEVPVWTALLPVTHGCGWRRAAGIGVIVNLVSHPLLWFAAYPALAAILPDGVALLLAEALVVAGEAALATVLLRRPRPVVRAGTDRAGSAGRTTPEAGPGPEGPGQEGRVQAGLVLGIALAANLLSFAAGLLLQAR